MHEPKVKFLTSIILDVRHEKYLREQPTFFPIYIYNFSGYSQIKDSDVNRKKNVFVPPDLFDFSLITNIKLAWLESVLNYFSLVLSKAMILVS